MRRQNHFECERCKRKKPGQPFKVNGSKLCCPCAHYVSNQRQPRVQTRQSKPYNERRLESLRKLFG